MTTLFTPIAIGNIHLSHCLVMAPLTRYRASDTHIPGPRAVEYYTQRASTPGTLLITEATYISPTASGMPNAPGIWNSQQILAWREVVDAVHAKGCFIICQLWAMGRAADPVVVRKEVGSEGAFVSSSAVAWEEGKEVPRALKEEEIWAFVKQYENAARNAVDAGFDAVEIHGANGYLVDQFTQDTCNQRYDAWGGSIEKRSRFGLEVTKAVVAAVGAERVGIRLSPFSTFQGMKMAEPIPQFSHLISKLKQFNLAYLHLVESRVKGSIDVEGTDKLDFALKIWGTVTPVLLAGGFTPESAKKAVESEYKDYQILITFGRYFTSNPDLVYRIRKGIKLAPYEREVFYAAKQEKGYADYPFSEEWRSEPGV